MEYFIRSGGHGTDDDLAQIILKLVCNFDYKKRGQSVAKTSSPKKKPVIVPHVHGLRMLATGQEARLSNSITLTKISGKGHTMQDYFVMQNRKVFSFDYQRKVVVWSYFADSRLFLNLTGGYFNQVQVTSSQASSAKVADTDKLAEAIRRSGKYMPGELYEQVKALLTPEALAGMAAFGAAYVASQLTPVGWIADAIVAVMFIGGVIFMGAELIEVGKLLIKFYETATNASSDAQYDEAGKYFAEAVIKVGVDVLVTIIFHRATKAVDRKIIKMKSNSGGGGGGNGGGNEVGNKKGTEFEKPKESEPEPGKKKKPTPRTNDKLVRDVEAKAAENIKNNSKKSNGPCLSGVYDPVTGNTSYGKNFAKNNAGKTEYAKFLDEAHPVIKERIAARDKAIREGAKVIEQHDPRLGAHSEVRALDAAIKARQKATGKPVTEADLGSFDLHNRNMPNNTPMHRCPNCSFITRGTNVVGGHN